MSAVLCQFRQRCDVVGVNGLNAQTLLYSRAEYSVSSPLLHHTLNVPLLRFSESASAQLSHRKERNRNSGPGFICFALGKEKKKKESKRQTTINVMCITSCTQSEHKVWPEHPAVPSSCGSHWALPALCSVGRKVSTLHSSCAIKTSYHSTYKDPRSHVLDQKLWVAQYGNGS